MDTYGYINRVPIKSPSKSDVTACQNHTISHDNCANVKPEVQLRKCEDPRQDSLLYANGSRAIANDPPNPLSWRHKLQ